MGITTTTRGRAGIHLKLGDATPLGRQKGFMLHYRGSGSSSRFGLSLSVTGFTFSLSFTGFTFC